MNNKLGGPRTEQGKARSSPNATKHGLRSNKMFVLQNENPEAWQAMLDACIEEFAPANAFEQKLVEEIAFAKWRLRRAWTVETALWDHEMEEQAEAFSQKFEVSDEGIRKALAFKALAENGKALSLIGRYESRLKRDYRNAIKVLEDRRQGRDRQISQAVKDVTTEEKAPELNVPNEPPKPQAATEVTVASARDAYNSSAIVNVSNELPGLPAPDDPVVH